MTLAVTIKVPTAAPTSLGTYNNRMIASKKMIAGRLKMSSRLLIVGVILSGSALTLLATEPPRPMKTGRLKSVRMLLSKNYRTQQQAKQQILAERKKMTSELSAIVADPENHVYRPESVRKAMELLGELRALEGIEVLVTYIGFPHVHHPDAGEYPDTGGGKNKPVLKGSPGEAKWLAEQFPAIGALINIGEPCIDAVISKLSTTDHPLEQTACTAVLKHLQQHPSVREKLRQAIPKVLPRKRAALEKALKALDEQPVSNEK